MSKSSTLQDIRVIDIPVVKDHRGNLAYIQNGVLPFEMKRVYYLFDVPSGAKRGGHAHYEQYELLVALSGSFDVILEDGKEKKSFHLNRPHKGLLIPPGIWRELENFSSGSICLVVNSGEFKEEDYMRDKNQFLNFKNLSR